MSALEFLCARRFHKQFTLPPNPDSGRSSPYRISYADYGDPTSNAVVLFCGGLMGSRICYSPLDQLAKTHRVRIIHPDRPGIGGSDPVPLTKRIETWLEIIPLLLSHLNIPHVSLASHSFGTIYLLNTLLAHPHLLHPQRPHVAFFAPWVHPAHTGIAHLQAAGMLPGPIIGKFASVARWVNGSITPLSGLSSAVGSCVVGAMKGSFANSAADATAPVPLALHVTGERASGGGLGREGGLDLDDPRAVAEVRKLITRFVFAENLDGVSQDAQMCLRKPRSIPWCSANVVWSDIDDAVILFKRLINEDERLSGYGRVWSVDAFHAETDGMVGEKGRKWFDECWITERRAVNEDESGEERACEYSSQVVKGADHDCILDPAFRASELWLKRVRNAVPVADHTAVQDQVNHTVS